MADYSKPTNCLICSSVLTSTENKVNKIDVLFLLQILLEIPQDDQLINNIKLRLNKVQICDNCESSIKHCKQIYSKICEQIEKFWEFRNKVLDKFSSSTPPRNILTDDELGENNYDGWVDQCRKFVKDHDISGVGYPFVIQDLKTLLNSLPDLPPQTLLATQDSNVKEEIYQESRNDNDNKEDIDLFSYDPPDSFDDNGNGNSDNDSDFEPSPSKKAKTSEKSANNDEENNTKHEYGVGILETKRLEIKLNRLITGQFICNWPGCKGDSDDGQENTFKFKECWEEHMERHRTSSLEKPIIIPQTYLCVWPDCNEGKGQEFKLKESWQVHMDRHQKTPKNECEECGRLFYSKDQLNCHVRLEHVKGRKRRRAPKKEFISKKEPVVGSKAIEENSEDDEELQEKDDKDEDYQMDDGPVSDNSDIDLESSKKPHRMKMRKDNKSNDKEDTLKAIFSCTWPGCNNGKGKGFKTQTSLDIHMDKHAGTPKRKCDKCDLSFYSYYELYRHLEGVHKVVKAKGKGVPKVKVKYNLSQDPVTGKYHCKWPGCEQSYVNLEHIKNHIDRHNGTPKRKCGDCDKLFYSRSQVNRHQQREHVGEKNYGCEICGVSYFVMADLADHRTKKHSDQFKKRSICETCGRTVRSSHLRRHMKVVHGEYGEGEEKIVKKFGCHLCPVRFDAEGELKLHLFRTHQVWGSEEEKEEMERRLERVRELRRKWRCPVKKCRIGYMREEGLRKHVEEKHGGDWGDGEGNVKGDLYKFRCEECGKGFHHKGRYKEHSETHKGEEERERRWKCEICGLGFMRENALRMHVERHGERERKWGCEICKKGFFEEKGLQMHLEGKGHKWRVEMVKEGGGVECEECGKRFKTADCLGQHRRKTHKKLKKEKIVKNELNTT